MSGSAHLADPEFLAQNYGRHGSVGGEAAIMEDRLQPKPAARKNKWRLEPVDWLSTAGNSTASALLWRQIDRQPTVSSVARSSP